MGIADTINKRCVQTAVYWGSPTNDGYGGFTFATPVEILVRWEEKAEIFMDERGEEKISLAIVYSKQDVAQNGYLYLGPLSDLDSNPDDPMEVDGAYFIWRFDKSPELGKTNQFIRKIYLGDNG